MTNTVPLNQTAQSIFQADGFTPRAVAKLVVVTQPDFELSVMPKLLDSLPGNGSMFKPADSLGNRLVSLPRIGNQFPNATVNGNNFSSGAIQMVVTTTDPSYYNIAAGTTIRDANSGCIATVLTAAEGTMTVQFVSNANGNTTFSSSDFVSNNTISYVGVVGNTIARQQVPGQFTVPTLDQYVIGRWDGFFQLTLEAAKLKTYFPNSNGTDYYAYQGEQEALNRMNAARMAYNYSNSAQVNSVTNPMSPSWIWQIQNFGGLTEGISPTMTLADFEAIVSLYKSRGGNRSGKVIIVGGVTYILTLQQLLRTYILQAGTTNVVGGNAVKGLGISEYRVAGLDILLVQDMFLENPAMWGVSSVTGRSTRSNSAIWFDPAPVMTQQGSVASIMDYYYSVDGLHRQVVEGMIDQNGNLISKGSNGQLSCDINFVLEATSIITNPNAAMYHGN